MSRQLTLPQHEMARRAEATGYLSLGLSGAALVATMFAVVIWTFQRGYAILPTVTIGLTVTLVSFVTFWMSRAGHGNFAAYLLVFGFLLETAAITVMFGGATGPLGILYVFSIMAGGIVIGTGYGFIVAGAAIVLFLLMIPVGYAGILPQIVAPPERGAAIPLFLAVWAVIFLLVAFLSWFASSRLNRALRDVRKYATNLQSANEKLRASEEELKASNEELEASNEELRATEEELRASNEELKSTNTELKSAHEKLIRTEKLAAIGQLAGGVGHELRNPLGAMKNAVYYVRSKLAKSEVAEKEPRVMEFLGIMDEEINSSSKIISDLLTFSRTGKPAVSPARIEKVIESAVAHCTIPDNIELTQSLSNSLPGVLIDTDQIRQVFINLITNSVQAMPEGGKLGLAARAGNGLMQVEIADTGSGITPEVMDKLFEPLHTTKAKGIGLGLAVCKSIVERHGGKIDVRSTPGKETVFTVNLPLGEAKAEANNGKN